MVSSEGIESAWLVMTMALLGSLLSSISVLVPRALGPYLSQLAIRSVQYREGSGGSRILVYGAGDLGVLFLDYLATQTRSSEMNELVGFVDDDERACGRVLRGFRILGNGRDLPRLVQERGIDQVVVTIDELPAGFLSRLEASLEGVQRVVGIKRWSCGFKGEESPEGASKEKDLGVGSRS